ncbi:MAG: nucleotidyltransferase family protein [Rhodospirillales bacterium]|nr:nucleotidyltransferase family protein [Rhodospirillales bacterium]
MSRSALSDTAFILAAGLGTRLRPYTNDIPKPMVEVGGQTMIDRALDKLHDIDIKSCVINTHYKGEILQRHLMSRRNPHIIFSPEEELLDTGGGINAALEHFDAPFFVLSGDSVWEDAPPENNTDHNTLQTMADHWDPARMDILILLQPVTTMALTEGTGDYDLDAQGRALRSKDKTGKYMWTSIRINKPEIFDDAPDGAFSYLELLDSAQKKGRLYGLVHDGQWHHISTPEDLHAVNEALKADEA